MWGTGGSLAGAMRSANAYEYGVLLASAFARMVLGAKDVREEWWGYHWVLGQPFQIAKQLTPVVGDTSSSLAL